MPDIVLIFLLGLFGALTTVMLLDSSFRDDVEFFFKLMLTIVGAFVSWGMFAGTRGFYVRWTYGNKEYLIEFG